MVLQHAIAILNLEYKFQTGYQAQVEICKQKMQNRVTNYRPTNIVNVFLKNTELK
jgi:hypothetical protein